MNRVSQLFTKKFIATALLSFNGIDTYFQTFRYFWVSGFSWLVSFLLSV